MSQNASFDFIIRKEANTITIKREFAAVRSQVWDAYTRSELLDQWWAPKPWKARTKTMDFREGGHWHYAMIGPAGEEHWAIANYQAIRPQQSFTCTDAFTDTEGYINTDLPQSAWEVTFAGEGLSTHVELKISYDDPAQLEATLQMGFEEGIAAGMENLDKLLISIKN